jgi:hypothetical protein
LGQSRAQHVSIPILALSSGRNVRGAASQYFDLRELAVQARKFGDRPKIDALLAKLDAGASLTVLRLQAAVTSHSRSRVKASRVRHNPYAHLTTMRTRSRVEPIDRPIKRRVFVNFEHFDPRWPLPLQAHIANYEIRHLVAPSACESTTLVIAPNGLRRR